MIAVVDYGAGNLCSVANTLDALQAHYELARTPEALAGASKIILPGVGHFGQMMRALDAMHLRDVLVSRIENDVPFLGICLGMQALFEGSDEAPETPGFGILPGRVQRFPSDLRVPHMGWNRISIKPGARLFPPTPSQPWFYFAHSYYVPDTEASAAQCTYSLTYTAAVERANIFGVQFHPEKSAGAGQATVRAFLDI